MIENVVDGAGGNFAKRLFAVSTLAITLMCCAVTAYTQTKSRSRDTVTEQVQQGSPEQKSASQGSEQSPAQKYFTDVLLVNQNGEKMRLYSDLLKGKVIIVNSFFGTCQGSCLPMNRNLEKVQQALGDRAGKDLRIISISVDSTVDTPAALREYAKKLHAGPGWFFLTGEKENVDFALRKLGLFVADKQDHLNIIIIGNERTGLWKKAFGLAPSDELLKVVESVLNDQPAAQ
jgi:protein SCO1/2